MSKFDHTGKPKFGRKDRKLKPTIIGKVEGDLSYEADSQKEQQYQKVLVNTILKGFHLLDIVDDKIGESYIPVDEGREDVREAVAALDPYSEDGTKIWFSFYKVLIRDTYSDMTNTAFSTVEYTEPGDSLYIHTVAKRKNVDPILLSLLSNGSSLLFIYILHKVLLAFLPADIAAGTMTPNPVGLSAQQAIGAAALAGIGALNDRLNKYFESGKVSTKDVKQIDDPIIRAFSALLDRDREMLILQYVDEYLMVHWEEPYYDWYIYKDLYRRVLMLYKKSLIKKIEIPVKTDRYIYMDIPQWYHGISSSKFLDVDFDLDILEKHKEVFDSYSKTLSEYPMITNAICCLFKYFIKFDVDFLKTLQTVLKAYKYKIRAKLNFSDMSLRELFADELLQMVNDFADDLIDKFNDAFDEGTDTALGCFAVRSFLDVIIDFINELRTEAKLCIQGMLNDGFRMLFEAQATMNVIMDSKFIDKLIAVLEFLIKLAEECEYDYPEGGKNQVYRVNDLVSEYFNTDNTFKQPKWTKDGIEATDENSYIRPIKIKHRNNEIILNKSVEREYITEEIYQSCDENLFNFDLNDVV